MAQVKHRKAGNTERPSQEPLSGDGKILSDWTQAIAVSLNSRAYVGHKNNSCAVSTWDSMHWATGVGAVCTIAPCMWDQN